VRTRKKEFKEKGRMERGRMERGKDGMGGGWKGKDGWMEEKSGMDMDGMKEKGKDGLKE
jgi:hypothetical protein